jgi:hypothetical protein
MTEGKGQRPRGEAQVLIPDRRTFLRGVGAMALICLVGVAFVLSYVGALHDPKPHGVPVSVVGPARLAAQLEKGGAFAAKPAADPAAATKAIDDRDTYASFVASPDGTIAVTTAPAAGAAIADAIEAKLVPALEQGGAKVTVQQVHPYGSEDARGLSGFYLAVGWTVAGYLGATFLGLLFAGAGKPGLVRTDWRLGAIALLGVLMGLLGTLAIEALGALDGPFLATAGIGALTVFAVGAATVALQSAFGLMGTGLAILIFVVLGNPSSSGPVPHEMLPGLWRAVGPFIPIGATVETLRNVTYFPDAGNLGALAVLVVWAVLGAGVAMALGNRNERYARAEAEIAEATSA